jgi:predicted transcriptional regulator
MQNIDNLNNIKVQDIVNTHPFVIKGETTVVEMLKYIKSQSAPINYLPVVNNDHAVIGAVTFINLIKGEL